MEEIDLKELFIMCIEKKLLIILVVIISALIGAIYTLKFITPLYSSTTSLVLVQTGSDDENDGEQDSITATDVTLNSKLVNNYSVIAKSKAVVDEVKNNLKLDIDIEDIQKSISVSAKTDTEVIEIAISNEDPELACQIANELAKVFTNKVIDIYKVNNVSILDVAEVDEEPDNIHLTRNIIIFAFVGFVAVLGYILLINMLDTTVKNDLDIEKTLKLPVLGSIMLTDENNKKKSSSGKRTRASVEFNHERQSIKIPYENESSNLKKKQTVEDEKNISMFSYMNIDENKEDDEKKKNDKKSKSSKVSEKRRKSK